MSRRIQSKAYQKSGDGTPDTYFDRVIKFIPSDVVAAWTTASAMLKDRKDVPVDKVLWGALVVGALVTWFWTIRQTQAPGAPPARQQAAISVAAFCVWVFALGAPFTSLAAYHSIYGGLLLIAFTLAMGIIRPD